MVSEARTIPHRGRARASRTIPMVCPLPCRTREFYPSCCPGCLSLLAVQRFPDTKIGWWCSLKISYKFVIPNPVNEQALSGPHSRAGLAREWAERASRGEGPCVSEVVKLHHYQKLSLREFPELHGRRCILGQRELPRYARDFACGLIRPQNGSTSTCAHPAKRDSRDAQGDKRETSSTN